MSMTFKGRDVSDTIINSFLSDHKKHKRDENEDSSNSLNSFVRTIHVTGRIEIVDSDGHLRSCPSCLGGVDGRRGIRRYARLAGTWGDLNGHIGSAADGYMGVHGGFGFGARNEEGHAILEFATAHDLVVANSFLKKRDAHLITFQSGGHNTQIDYLLVRRGDLRACKDCRAILSEACSSQHRTTISKKLSVLEEDMSASNADKTWNTLTRVIKDAAKDSLGVANESARTHSTHRESWWFSDEVQTKVAVKHSMFKELLSCREGNQEDIDMAKERYKVAKREAKIAVSRAKDKAYEDLYKKLDSKEGANDIYKIAKAREKR
ncbi:retrovirus-related pol polyprotein LINE-1 [Tanacetum coccineum]